MGVKDQSSLKCFCLILHCLHKVYTAFCFTFAWCLFLYFENSLCVHNTMVTFPFCGYGILTPIHWGNWILMLTNKQSPCGTLSIHPLFCLYILTALTHIPFEAVLSWELYMLSPGWTVSSPRVRTLPNVLWGSFNII